MDTFKEIRLDKTKVTHIKIKDGFKGISTGLGIKQYKFLKANYVKFFNWKHLQFKAGFWRDGKQNEARFCAMYETDEILNNESFVVDDNWVYTKPSAIIYVGEQVIKTLYFIDLDSAKRYCDINFPNVNFTI
jgi:hypothetical protein